MELLLIYVAIVIQQLAKLFTFSGLPITISQKSECEYTKLLLHAPVLHFKEYEDSLADKNLSLVTSFDTNINYFKNDFFVAFNIKVLGFGITFKKQTGY